MKLSRHKIAVIAAFFVTVLWSSSWVLIKIGLRDISPLFFAGIRYTLASLILISVVMSSPGYREEVRNLDTGWWTKLSIYGILYYAITQGSQFVGLYYLQAITVSFLLNLTAIVVLILGVIILEEYPSNLQMVLIIAGVLGVYLYFIPLDVSFDQMIGLIIVGIGVLANSLSSIVGRALNQTRQVSPFVITTVSMSLGSILLLGFSILFEGLPNLNLRIILIIFWLAIINTALAFVIWNYTLQEIAAVESSIINSTMLPQITVLAIIFFDEKLIFRQWVGLFLIFLTGLLISWFRSDDIGVGNKSSR